MPWKDLAADLLGPLLTGEYLLVVVVDYYNRFFEVAVTMSVTVSKMICYLENMFAAHGLPLSLRTDNGRNLYQRNLRLTSRTITMNTEHQHHYGLKLTMT